MSLSLVVTLAIFTWVCSLLMLWCRQKFCGRSSLYLLYIIQAAGRFWTPNSYGWTCCVQVDRTRLPKVVDHCLPTLGHNNLFCNTTCVYYASYTDTSYSNKYIFYYLFCCKFLLFLKQQHIHKYIWLSSTIADKISIFPEILAATLGLDLSIKKKKKIKLLSKRQF